MHVTKHAGPLARVSESSRYDILLISCAAGGGEDCDVVRLAW